MPAPLGLVIGRNDRWPRTKETPLEGHRGSTPDFSFSCCLFIPLVSLLTGTTGDVPRIKIVRNFEKGLRGTWEKKKKSILEGRILQSEGGLITRNTWSSCYFSLYLYLPFDSNEWWTRRTVDQDRVENARRKRSWETVTKWTRKNLFVLLSPRKNGGTQKTENQDQENR